VILRDTRTYAELLEAGYHPDYLGDALERDRLFDKLWLRTVHQPHLTPAIEAEQRDLRLRDIPLFTTRPNSRDLWTSQDEPILDFFEETGMDAVGRRLERLSEKDLNRQLWLIESSLATLGQAQKEVSHHQAPPIENLGGLDKDMLPELAGKVAQRLSELAVQDGDLAIWYGCRYVHDRWSTELVGLDLYDGLPGIALFLAYFGDRYGKDEYTSLAKAAFATVETYLHDRAYQPSGMGGFSGLGGILFALSHLGTLWNRPDLIDLGESLVVRYLPLISADEQYDIVSGTAGYLAGLLSLYATRPNSVILTAAQLCGDRLCSSANWIGTMASWMSKNVSATSLAGFSHGAAGIAHSLIALFGVTGETRYLRTAEGAIEFERTLYSHEAKNWLDRRNSTPEHGATCMTAWCHGAPGIGLARLSSLAYLDDRTIRAEIDTALKTTLEQGFGGNHSLCHGDLGNLELLLEASLTLNDPYWKTQLDHLTTLLLAKIDRQGWLCGVPLPVETPGLMTGLAGIGYQLLRLADPHKVPSVLTLQPPRIC
jgi:type 2 lantibiotic biosynthesis protein LanM